MGSVMVWRSLALILKGPPSAKGKSVILRLDKIKVLSLRSGKPQPGVCGTEGTISGPVRALQESDRDRFRFCLEHAGCTRSVTVLWEGS